MLSIEISLGISPKPIPLPIAISSLPLPSTQTTALLLSFLIAFISHLPFSTKKPQAYHIKYDGHALRSTICINYCITVLVSLPN